MNKDQKNTGIYSNLEANIMIFNFENKNIFFISVDTLFITKELKESLNNIIDNLFKKTHKKDIIIVSSHTHYAPTIEKNRTKLGNKDIQYYTFLLTQIETALKRLKHASFQEVELKYSIKKSSGHTCNRRRKVRRFKNYFQSYIGMEPNKNGFIDEQFKILNIYNKESHSLTGSIWSFPCHPTNFPNRNLITSEYPGEIRELIRNKATKNIPIIYFPGFAGDVRAMPPERKSPMKVIRTIFQLSYPDSYFRFSDIKEYEKWTKSLLNTFKNEETTECLLNQNIASFKTSTVKEPLINLGITVKNETHLQFRKIQLAQNFAIYTISAEPVGEISKLLIPYTPEKHTIYSGYTDSVFGYLPVKKQIKEGGYESKGFFEAFLVSGKFNNSIESIIISNIKKLNNVR